MAIFELPFSDRVERTSGPSKEGFAIDEINYSGKIRQVVFSGPSQEASREEVYQINWKQIEYNSALEVLNGAENELGVIFDFYKQAYLGKVRWKPFEVENSRIWEIVPESLSRTNVAGCLFDVSIKLSLLYTE